MHDSLVSAVSHMNICSLNTRTELKQQQSVSIDLSPDNSLSFLFFFLSDTQAASDGREEAQKESYRHLAFAAGYILRM